MEDKELGGELLPRSWWFGYVRACLSRQGQSAKRTQCGEQIPPRVLHLCHVEQVGHNAQVAPVLRNHVLHTGSA